jgi:NAD(P)-dependent dehydrogenase (short-subunit alcohol dehydrogenase family)
LSSKLDSRVAIITGSTAGIGRSIAELFAAEGAQVVVNGRREELGHEVVEGIRSCGGTATFYRADISKAVDLSALITHAVDTYGHLDILVNNAWSGQTGTVLDTDENAWDYLFATTLKACYLGSKYALPHLIDAGEGVIISLSSVHGVLAARAFAPYDVAKAGIIQLTRSLAVDYGPHGVRVNAICPGLILTEYALEFLERHPEYRRQTETVYPLQRPGRPIEVAKAALFLASDDSSFITGHALMVDGGLTIQLQDSLAEALERRLRAELDA